MMISEEFEEMLKRDGIAARPLIPEELEPHHERQADIGERLHPSPRTILELKLARGNEIEPASEGE